MCFFIASVKYGSARRSIFWVRRFSVIHAMKVTLQERHDCINHTPCGVGRGTSLGFGYLAFVGRVSKLNGVADQQIAL